MDFTRTMVIGSAGSGKTTFSLRLAKLLGKDVVHLDRCLMGENWQEKTYQERKALHDELISKDNWLIDGMWGSHLADRLERATCVIFLDYPAFLCLARAKNRLKKWQGKQREDLAEGCIENDGKEFLQYIKSFHKTTKKEIRKLVDSYKNKIDVVTFKLPCQVEHFLKKLGK